MKNNKKIFVYMVLFIVFVAQVAFTRPVTAGTDASNAGVQTDAGAAEVKDTDDNMMVSSMGKDAASDAADISAYALNGAETAEQPQLELNVVYRNTLTVNGEIVDDLEEQHEKSDFENKVISYCEDRVSIYAEPDSTSEVVGCMYSRSQGDILEKGEVWTKISSGNVVGYVKNVYMLFGEEADMVAPFIGDKTTTVTADALNVYASADANSQVIATYYAGETIRAYEEIGNWVLVECPSGYGYVDENGITSSYNLAVAWTIEEETAYLEEQARIEAERIEAERAAAARLAQSQSIAMGRTTNEAMQVSDAEVYLLACIIEWEAGWEPYEGKLAVANVVLNRVRSPRFAQNNITDVIYSPGQFTGVLDSNGNISERFSALLANGPTHEDCYTAAGEALAGVNNIGEYLFFISVKKANYARYIQYTVINNHCFYAY